MKLFAKVNRSFVKMFLFAILALFAGFGTANAADSLKAKSVHVVTAGVNQSLTCPPEKALLNAEKDAVDVANLYKAQKGKLNNDIHVEEPLLGATATRQNIFNAINKLKQTAGPESLSILFLSGHGITVANGRAYLATFDGMLYCFGVPQAARK